MHAVSCHLSAKLWCKCKFQIACSLSKFFYNAFLCKLLTSNYMICSLWKIYKSWLHQVALKIMILLVNSVHKTYCRKSRLTEFWKRVHAIYNLLPCYNFALMLHENAIVFSQSEARNFSCLLLIMSLPKHACNIM